MALNSKCPKCDGWKFEVATESLKDSNYKLNFVRCSTCGCVVGVMDLYDIGYLVNKLAQKLKVSLD